MRKLIGFILFAIGVIVLFLLVFLPEVPNGPEYVTDGDSLSLNENNMGELTLTSPAFSDGASIPSKYTCDGDNINPALKIGGVPDSTKSLVLIMDDPDIPDSVKEKKGIEVFDHWVVFNISPETTDIFEGQEPQGVLGRNSGGSMGYIGACPPDREHRYFFKLYALDTMLDLEERATKKDVEEMIQGHILEQTQLMGLYKRN